MCLEDASDDKSCISNQRDRIVDLLNGADSWHLYWGGGIYTPISYNIQKYIKIYILRNKFQKIK